MNLKKSQMKKLFLDYSDLWSSVDNTSSQTVENYKISCAKGCDYCCKQVVIITVPEALAIIYAINKDCDKANYFDTWIVRKIHNQKLLCLSMAVTATTWFNNQRACIFLKGDGTCWAYEHRPSICRALLVTSAPENCGPPGENLIYPIIPTLLNEHRREISKKWAESLGIPIGKSPLPMAFFWANMIYHRGRDAYLTAIKDTAFEKDRSNLVYWSQRFGSIDMREDIDTLQSN